MQYKKDLKKMCPYPIRKDLQNMITKGLVERFSKRLSSEEKIEVTGFTGEENGYLIISLGTPEKMHVLEFFTKNKRGDELDGALGLLLDYADQVLEDFFRHKRNRAFPIDFIQNEYDKHPIWAKYELKNLKAEALRDEILNKDKKDNF